MSRRWRRWRRFAAALGVAASAWVIAWYAFPYPLSRLSEYPASERVVDRDGRPLRVYASSRGEFCFPVSLAAMSPWLARATVAVEDRRFHSHWGVDPAAIGRAVLQNLARGRVHSGASTIPQQLVRILDQRPRTLWSKVVEAFHALQLNAQASKEHLLAAYLNLAPYGGNLRGVEAASQRYFGKSAASLSLAEAALLAGVPQSPSRLRLDLHLDRALLRREIVLAAMLRDGLITEAERDQAASFVPRVIRHPWPFRAPHHAELARTLARGAAAAASTGVVTTCLDGAAQAAAERWLQLFFAGDRLGRRTLSGAVVVLDVETREIRALVGSPDFFDAERKGKVNVALRPRSPGSTLKPLLYAFAFERGIATPDSWLPDSPRVYATYSPENFEGNFLGPISARRALALSRNAPAVYLAEKLGVEAFCAGLHRAGISTLSRAAKSYGLTLAVGACEVRLVDLVSAYAMLVGGGVAMPWRVLAATPRSAGELVVGRGSARLVLEALSTEEHLGRAAPELASRWAGALGYKTGTSNGLRDAWAIAFTREHVVGIWLGDPRGRAHPDLIGLQAAAPLALGLASELQRIPTPLGGDPAEGVQTRPICALTGHPVDKFCPAIIAGRVPGEARALAACTVHREIRVDAATGVEVCVNCSAERPIERRIVEVWPTEAGVVSSLPPHDPDCKVVAAGVRPRILSPANGSEYRLHDAARFEQKIFFDAVASGATRVLHWFVNGAHVAATPPTTKVPWRPTRGRHEVRCVDDRGRGSTVTIRVR